MTSSFTKINSLDNVHSCSDYPLSSDWAASPISAWITSSWPNTPTIVLRDSSFYVLVIKGGFRCYLSWSVLITRHICLRERLFNCSRHAPDASAYETRSSLNFYGLMSPTFYDAMQIQRLRTLLGLGRELSCSVVLPLI